MPADTSRATTDNLSLDQMTAMTRSLPITLVLLTAVLLPHALLHRENAFSALMASAGVWLALPGFFLSIVVHEVLHALAAMAFGGLRWNEISFGMNWKTLTAYAHPRVPVPARAYAAVAAAPGIVLGLVPAVVGLATGSGAWSGYGALMLAAAAGDVLILWILRSVPATALVQDHPSRVGCSIVPAAPAALPT